MTNMGEIGNTVGTVLTQQAGELAALVAAAGEVADDMRRGFAAGATGGNNELISNIDGRLTNIRASLGQIATEVEAVKAAGGELLAAWGIDTATHGNTASVRDITPASAAIGPPQKNTTINPQYDPKNPERLSAMQHREMYLGMGIDLAKLGCIMLDTEPIVVGDVIDPDDLYFAANEKRNPYAKGTVSETVPHVTVLQGLLTPGPEQRDKVDRMLKGWNVEDVTIKDITYFAGADPEEPFDCIVAELDTAGALREGNSRLQMLPHINVYPPDYRAHISLAYIRRDPERRDAYIRQLRERYAGKKIRVTGLNYGR